LLATVLTVVVGTFVLRPWSWLAVTGANGLFSQIDEPAEPEVEGPPPEFKLDHDAHCVVRRSCTGQLKWSTPLDGYLGLVRPPHLVFDADRVYVTHGNGVTALDAGTGKLLWHSTGPSDRMCLSGDLLLASDCSVGDEIVVHGRWLVARAVSTGDEVFRVRLPTAHFETLPIQEVAGLFLVQEWDQPGGKGDALLIDREGQIVHRLDRQVIAGKIQDEDHVFLTSHDVVRVSTADKVIWTIPFRHQEWIAGGDILELAEGDLLAFLYGAIHDGGVQVIRLRPGNGTAVWETACPGLGVMHSAYSHHAKLCIDGGRVEITSHGSSGTFVEFLDLATGKQLGRKQWKRYW
jgi:outer membrane protein assembly factor BamB